MIRRSAVAVSLVVLSIWPGLSADAGTLRADRGALVPVFTFHHVKWLKPADNAIERGLTVQPDLFAAEMRYLLVSGHHPITALRLVSFLRTGGTLPTRAVVLTFDDGYADMYTQVYPYLRRSHLRATFFIVPGFLDTPRYLTWTQVADMARHGMDIEAHSLTHPDLTTLPPARAAREVAGSRRELQSRLHRSVSLFAYPYGAVNASVIEDVRKAGYLAAFTTRQGWWQSRSDRLTLPRVYPDDSLKVFEDRVSGHSS
ncbi:MAG: hypothetical protein PVSMB7_26840 [Chloroflexota bacterium]